MIENVGIGSSSGSSPRWRWRFRRATWMRPDEIPCVEDVSCPNDYPVCGPPGSASPARLARPASVAIVGADGHAQADFLSGTVRVLVSAREPAA